jgi:putative phosphoribosyl transferase
MRVFKPSTRFVPGGEEDAEKGNAMYFTDRFQAGRLLAANLTAYWRRQDVVIFALPRGGVTVGAEVAAVLEAPLDVLIVRKVGLPGYPEMAIGAIASGGIELISENAVARFQVEAGDLQKVIAREREEVSRQEKLFRGDRPFPEMIEKVAILVDDGLATGHTMKAAIASIRLHEPREIVVAVPVGAPDTCRLLKRSVNQVICLSAPREFAAVGAYYEDFSPVGDDEVRQLLAKANRIPVHDPVHLMQ